jgi:hypothetical protein
MRKLNVYNIPPNHDVCYENFEKNEKCMKFENEEHNQLQASKTYPLIFGCVIPWCCNYSAQ